MSKSKKRTRLASRKKAIAAEKEKKKIAAQKKEVGLEKAKAFAKRQDEADPHAAPLNLP